MARTVKAPAYRKDRREHGCIVAVKASTMSIDEMFAAAAEARNA